MVPGLLVRCAVARAGVCLARSCAACVLLRVVCVCGVRVRVGVTSLYPPCGLVCVLVYVKCVGMASLDASPYLSRQGLAVCVRGCLASPWVQLLAFPAWGPVVVLVLVDPSPILAEGSGCSIWPFLAGV